MKKEDVSFWDVLKNRRSVRQYKDEAIPQELLDELNIAATMAPVAGGNRNVTCQVFTDAEFIRSIADGVRTICDQTIEKIPDAGMQKEIAQYSKSFTWFGAAPAFLAISCRKPPAYMKHLGITDLDDVFGGKASASMSAQNIMLAATALGLGTCCLTGPLFAKSWLQKELDCPKQNELVAILTVGFSKKS